MPAPTSGLTAQWDASTVADIWQAFSGGMFQDHPAAGASWDYWKNRIDLTEDANTQILWADGSPKTITWQNPGPMRLPSVRLTQGFLRTRTAGGAGISDTAFMSQTTGMQLLAFRFESASTIPNSATLYFNCNLLGHGRNGYWGAFIRKDGSNYFLTAYIWDGSAKTVELPITPDASHVVYMRHESDVLYLSLDCGAEVSVAAGTIANVGAVITGDQGLNSGTEADLVGNIGEELFYNVSDAATALAASEYLCDKWLAPEIVDEVNPDIVTQADPCAVSSGGGQSAGGCVNQFPTIGTQAECVGGGLVPTAPDLVRSETWWGNA